VKWVRRWSKTHKAWYHFNPTTGKSKWDPQKQEEEVSTFYDGQSSRKSTERPEALNRACKMNNALKAALIHVAGGMLPPTMPLAVLDLCCGKGGDLHKFTKEAGLVFYRGIDISPASIAEARRRATGLIVNAEFVAVDIMQLSDFRGPYSLVSCQFAMHYMWKSAATAEHLISRVSAALCRGGLFIFTVPDAARVHQELSNKTRWEVTPYCRVSSAEPITSLRPAFGHVVHYRLQGLVNLPEYLVPFYSVEALAERHGMVLEFKKNLTRLKPDIPPVLAKVARDADDKLAQLYICACFRKC